MSSSKWESRLASDPYGNEKKMQEIKAEQLRKQKRSAFPERFTYSGHLHVRTEGLPQWRRKYFVLNHNFLLCGDDPYSEKLAACIPLEGSNIRQTTQSSDVTFELTTHSQNKKRSKKAKNQKQRKRKKYFFKADSAILCSRWTEHIERASTLAIKDIYRLRFNLGNADSQSARVVAAKHRVTNEEYAIKIIDKRKCDVKLLDREIQILKNLSNEYIVELCDLFETKNCRGGELFDMIANLDGDHYSEEDCCDIMHQLASGVQYMHDMGICHRDLKPENILCVEDSIKRVKIADFGISAMAKNKAMKTRVGTLSYTAPEILAHKPYDFSVDYWSLGVIMYILVCGYPPFDGDNDYDVADSITNDSVDFDQEDWNHVSKDTQSLVARLLSKDPKKRGNCNSIIKLSWKVQVSHAGFKKAHNKFKETVMRRKIGGRASYDDNNVKLSHEQKKKQQNNNKHPQNHEKERKRRKKKARDDMSFNKTNSRKRDSNLTEQIKAQQVDKVQNGFRGRLGSKGTEHLFLEHMHPMNYRDSFTRNEFGDEWMTNKEERAKKRRNSKSKSKPVNQMQTVTEADEENEDV